jgi:hypothetical protein
MEAEPCQRNNDYSERGDDGEESSEARTYASRQPSVWTREEPVQHNSSRDPHRERRQGDRDQYAGTDD